MNPIALARAAVHHLVQGPLPTFLYLPGNLEQLPCYVVGRPTLTEGSTRALAEIAVPVFVCGRTLRDDEAQGELDRYADLLVTRLWTPPPAEGLVLRLTRAEPVTVTVAGAEAPAYTVTVVCETALC